MKKFYSFCHNIFLLQISIHNSDKKEVSLKKSIYFFLLISVSLSLSNFGSIEGQIVNEDIWVPNSTVFATVRFGNTIYIGGHFDIIGPSTGHGAAISIITAEPDLSYAKVNGHIYAVVSDGSGGWYIGGYFTKVGGVDRNNIAHIYEDGSLDEHWNPDANSGIWSLYFYNSTVYAGGSFTQIGGSSRNYIAALEPVRGDATSWNPGTNNTVRAIIVSGSQVYCAGLFTSVGGEARNYIAEVDANTGSVTEWNPNAGGYIYALDVSGSTVFAGGAFIQMGGEMRSGIAAIDAVSGNVTSWNPNFYGGTVFSLAVAGTNVYVGGWFTNIGGVARNRIAAIDTATGMATSWNPNSDGQVNSIIVYGSTVFVGGIFSNIGGEERKKIAALDIVTGNVTDWNPLADREVLSLAASSSNIYAGGRFASIGGINRNFIAAIDAITGKATDWNPGADDDIDCISVYDSIVYVGGKFTNIAGNQRNYIAALNSNTGLATSWNPGANNRVSTISVSGSLIYAGGYFTQIGGLQRNYIAALDKNAGNATSWNPNANSRVLTIEKADSNVYVGGYFTKIGAQIPQLDRIRIAALNAETGDATNWNPNANAPVWCLKASDSLVYVGGEFNYIGGEQRFCIAAINKLTGLATVWNPIAAGGGPPTTYVRVIDVSGSVVYVGGSFSWIGQEFRKSMAALDVETGMATGWDPNPITYVGDPPSEIYALDVIDSTVYMGGLFYEVMDKLQQIFAGVSEDIVPVELVNFNANVVSNAIELIWATATEVNNSGFEIHRKDQKDNEWETIGFMPGFGTTTEPKSYSFIDNDITTGIYKYRLKQIDFDGTFEYSTQIEVAVDFSPKEFMLYQNFPNPFNPVTKLKYSIPSVTLRQAQSDIRVTLIVYDILGREVTTLVNEEKPIGEYEVEFNAANLPSGIYFYQLKAGGFVETKKMILLK